METKATGELFHKMFVARGVTLVAGAVLLGIGIFGMLPVPWYLILGPWDELYLKAILCGVLIIIAGGSLVTWYYVFHVALREGGVKYAVGHLLICMALTPVALTGIIFIPLQIYNDADRWRQTLSDSSDPLNPAEMQTPSSGQNGIGKGV